MPFSLRRVDYFYVTVPDQPGEAYRLLTGLADQQVKLLAFTAIPVGPAQTQMAIFPEDNLQLRQAADRAGLPLDGPHPAILVHGDNELSGLAKIHEELYQANINVYAATGVTGGSGGFGYIIYIRPEQYQAATAALGL